MSEVEVSDPNLMKTLGGGAVIERLESQYRTTLEFEAHLGFCHSGNIVQGGFVTAWLDSAMSHAVMYATDFKRAPSSLEIKVNFIKSANPGKIRAVGWVKHMGGKIVFVEGELFNAAGELLATSSSTAKLINLVPDS